MSYIFIDRRKDNKNKNVVNRQKFLDRVKSRVKEAVQDAIKNGNIADILSKKRENVTVPAKDIKEPTFTHSSGGFKERVYPGNKQFTTGDRVPRPPSGEGKGREGSNSGEGEDEFSFTISRDEFLHYLFDDLELHDLIKKESLHIDEYQMKRSGFVPEGDPGRINLLRSMHNSSARRRALKTPKKKKIKLLEEEKLTLLLALELTSIPEEKSNILLRIEEIDTELSNLKRRLDNVPFIDTIDLRYHNYVKQQIPITMAVMVCILDTSGSMGEWEKEMAKRFFMLLYLFLTKNYKKIELVFVRHHTEAFEVDEEEFFNSRETGGTMVSPALTLTHNIIKDRYPLNKYNIYVTQISDGDNYRHDNEPTLDIIKNKLLPIVQQYLYIETTKNGPGMLWNEYGHNLKDYDNFSMAKIEDDNQVLPVFREVFKKR